MRTKKDKKAAIHKVLDAYKKLCEYRGIPYYPEECEANVRSMADLVYKLQNFENALDMPIKPATDKQLKYMASLMCETEKEIFAGKILNVYQASEAIRILLQEDELLDSEKSEIQDFDETIYRLVELSELCEEIKKPRRKRNE